MSTYVVNETNDCIESPSMKHSDSQSLAAFEYLYRNWRRPSSHLGPSFGPTKYKPYDACSLMTQRVKRNAIRRHFRDTGKCEVCMVKELKLLSSASPAGLFSACFAVPKPPTPAPEWMSESETARYMYAKSLGCKAEMPGACLECKIGVPCTF